jgi:hypothetical protein
MNLTPSVRAPPVCLRVPVFVVVPFPCPIS